MYFFVDYQRNPYKPTYTFPDDYNGDSDLMEDYVRKTATKTIDKDNRKRTKLFHVILRIIKMISFVENASFSPVRTLTSSLK